MEHETASGSAAGSSPSVGSAAGFSLLNDLPAGQSAEDLLGMRAAAAGIAKVVRASAAESPFAVAVDADWGMGKSTLLQMVKDDLDPPLAKGKGAGERPFRTVWFNAWTAEGDNALAGLIKSVLAELDPNIIRRTLGNVAKRKRLIGIAGISLTVLARFFGVSRLVDELWTRLYLDAESRNRLRKEIGGMLTEWVSKSPEHVNRCIVVFIDDLDRCSDDVVVKVCEAVKLYLDVRGLIFVLACDQSVLARGVQDRARGGPEEARSYLEKIIQVQYRLPAPDNKAIERLIDGYAETSRTPGVIEGEVRRTLTESCGRNPRRIKRIINSFILEYELSPGWKRTPLSSYHLLIAIVLQHLYTPFYDLVVRGQFDDPISEFLAYAELRQTLQEQRIPSAGGWQDAGAGARDQLMKALARYEVYPSKDEETDRNRVIGLLDEHLPEEFSALVGNRRFRALLTSMSEESREPFLKQLLFHPLVTESPEQLPSEEQEHVAVVISRRDRVRADEQGDVYGEVGGAGQYDSDRGVWAVGQRVREKARYAIVAVDGIVRRVYAIDPDGWHQDPSGKWEFRAVDDRECTAAEIRAAHAAGDLPFRPGDDCPTGGGGAYRPHWF